MIILQSSHILPRNTEESQIEQNDNPTESFISLSQISTIKNENEFMRENSQNFFQYNKRFSVGEINNKESSLDTSIISKIKGDEIENNLNNNSNNYYYLGNLFRDVVNKYDMEKNNDITESRFFIRRTLYLKQKGKKKKRNKIKKEKKIRKMKFQYQIKKQSILMI